MPVEVDGKQADAVIEGLVRAAAGLIRLESDEALEGTSGDRFDRIQVRVTNNNQPATGVPVRFSVVGGVAYPLRLVSTSEGVATLTNVRIFGRTPRLRAHVDLATLASVDFREKSLAEAAVWVRTLNALKREVDLRLSPLAVRLDGEVEPGMLSNLGSRLGLTAGTDSVWSLRVVVDDLGCRDLSMRRTCAVIGSLNLGNKDGVAFQVRRKVRGTAADDDGAMAQIENACLGASLRFNPVDDR